MGEHIEHHCGLAMVRLRKPLLHYQRKYGDPAWGLRRLYLLLEKQHNRGQDGAGIATVKLDMPPGEPYLRRERSTRHNSLERIFDEVTRDIHKVCERIEAGERFDDLTLKQRCAFLGEVYLGHLRYGTHSGNERANCHPLVRKNNVASRNLALAGNFNMTNSGELFRQLVEYGLNPVGESDTQVILERLGYFLDREHDQLHATLGPESFQGLTGRALADAISAEIDLTRILRKAAQDWDGGYAFIGMLGNGDAFACRDPAGIRPAFFFIDEEILAVASERAALAGVFDVEPHEIQPVQPGCVLVMKRDGAISHDPFAEPLELRQCTFERIYFSRGNDPDIYRERKELGRNLASPVLAAIDRDLDHAVFSYIPNTAEAAYIGLIEEVERRERQRQAEQLTDLAARGGLSADDIRRSLRSRVRAEKIAHKDQRLRTFITHDEARRNLVMHIYDITRGIIQPEDTLVVLDDSIVRGTTLRESIITILSRLNPRRIVIASSAPPIMYPDCYGIDMSQLGRFIAFEAAVNLLHERGEQGLLEQVEQRCLDQAHLPPERMTNHVAEIYERFTPEELSAKVAALVRPRHITWSGEITVLYQTVAGLQAAMPAHTGDWYFTGRYPTPGGYKVLNTSFLNWRRKKEQKRAYEAADLFDGRSPTPRRPAAVPRG